MGTDSKVEWCHHTFNGWIGCEKVSAECKNCYAEVETFPRVQRGKGLELWGKNAARHITSDENWRKPFAWDRRACEAGERHRVFCSSLSDVFEDRPDLVAPRARLMHMIVDTPNLDWLLLTKRPENVDRLMPWIWPRNTWLGVTGGTQKMFDERVERLLEINGPAIHFVSIEPMLERVNVAWALEPVSRNRLRWVIVGGESGSKARRFDVRWAQEILWQCQTANTSKITSERVAYFLKQLGANVGESNPNASETIYEAWDPLLYRDLKHPKGGDPEEWPKRLFWAAENLRQFPTVAR